MPLNTNEDTIAAIATPLGEGGVGMIRVSGPQAFELADRIFESKKGLKASQQKSYTAQYGWIVDPSASPPKKIDEAILLAMRKPRSYTSEDMVELTCHGGRVVMQKILEVCLKSEARLAEPGEFTKRAFLNGRIDLVQAETVLDLIRAKTERSYHAAQSQLEGHLSKLIQQYRDTLVYLSSHIEASLDFPDDDVTPMGQENLIKQCRKLKQDIDSLIESSHTGRLIKEGLKAVITGKPNVGKSSLLNAMTKEDRAIVSDIPGTTRDTVEAQAQMEGCEVRFFDTAGIRLATEPLEVESVQRSHKIVEKSDLILFVVDASLPWNEEEKQYWEDLKDRPKVLVLNKSDLLNGNARPNYREWCQGAPAVEISCHSLKGIDALKNEIVSYILNRSPERSDEVWVYSVRQLDLFRRASGHIDHATDALEKRLSSEFAAADLRLAMDALGEIVGEVVTDDILDLVFSQFCIGK